MDSMDIRKYNELKQGLVEFNERCQAPFGNKIVSMPPTDTKYPYTRFLEVRNVANANYNTCFQRVASVGYRVDIFAQDKGTKYNRLDIAREISQMVDAYLTGEGLTRVSYNIMELVGDGSICQIIMTYSGNLHENRSKFI